MKKIILLMISLLLIPSIHSLTLETDTELQSTSKPGYYVLKTDFVMDELIVNNTHVNIYGLGGYDIFDADNSTVYVSNCDDCSLPAINEVINITITIVDTTLPVFSNNQASTTVAGGSCQFSITVTDETALQPNGQYIFSTNNTGSWTNHTTVNFTSALTETATNTTVLNSTVGVFIQWRFYASDNAGNWNVSGVYNLTTTAVAPVAAISSAGKWRYNPFDDELDYYETCENINLFMLNKNTSATVCNAASEGYVYYDGDTHKHYGCNGTHWSDLN